MQGNWTKSVQSESDPSKMYKVQYKDGTYSCSCIAWKKQYLPVNERTCKHLRSVLGDYEECSRAPESCRSKGRTVPTNRKLHKPNPMLFDRLGEANAINWLYSVKMDGIFGRWTGSQLVTRGGRSLSPSRSVLKGLPADTELDGEVYAGLDGKNKVRTALGGKQWPDGVRFVVFDLKSDEPFERRLKRLRQLQRTHGFDLAPYYRLKTMAELKEIMQGIEDNGQEGIVIRSPRSTYRSGKRVKDVLKLKPTFEGRGKVLEHLDRKKGMTVVVKEGGRDKGTFNVYVPVRSRVPAIGSSVDFTYSGRTETGKPEIPRIVGVTGVV